MRYLILFFVLIVGPLKAEPPHVVTTIAPLYGIVSDLMRGVGEPTPIVSEGLDAHYFSLKPSQIFALNDADIVFAVGGDMEPWLARVLPGIEAEVIYMADILALRDHRLPLRSLDQIGNADPVTEVMGFDPHMWLDPRFARLWVLQAALSMSDQDPDNSEIYHANARDILEMLEISNIRLQEAANAIFLRQLVTSHDSLQYLEKQFALNIVGALSSASGDQAGARSISRLAQLDGDVCLLIDSSEDAANFGNLFLDWPQVGFDPMGYAFAGSPNYLPSLYLSIAAALESCITVR